MDRLRRARGSQRAQLTKLECFLNSEETPNLIKLQVKLQLLEGVFTEFRATQTSIEEKADEDDIDGEYDERTITEDKYVELKATILEKIEALKPAQNSVLNADERRISHDRAEIVLPKLQLPTFGGKYEEWATFHDLFSATVDQNKNLSEIQKYFYLKSTLRDEPLQLIQSLPLTSENYHEAWKMLTNRYANNRLIVRAHLNKVFSLSKMSVESAESLRAIKDTTTANLRALENLKLSPSPLSDAMLIYWLTSKLDNRTLELWETEAAQVKEFPTLTNFMLFLEQRINALALLPKAKVTSNSLAPIKPKRVESVRAMQISDVTPKETMPREVKPKSCIACDENHALYTCPKFKEKSVSERFELVKNAGICFNCFRKGHRAPDCSGWTCRECKRKHHTLLHAQPAKNKMENPPDNTESTVANALGTKPVLLATVLVIVYDCDNKPHKVRALLDPGSQLNLLSESCVQRLKLPTHASDTNISGVASLKSSAKKKVNCTIKSSVSPFEVNIEAVIVSKVTGPLPQIDVVRNHLPLAGKVLADPEFDKPGRIDLLLNAEFFLDIFQEGHIPQTLAAPAMRNTVFGWIVAGKAPLLSKEAKLMNSQVNQCSISEALEKFWKTEEFFESNEHSYTREEEACELHFSNTTTREADGRFCVRLPVKGDLKTLGESRNTALRILNCTQKKLSSSQRVEYAKFMNEYLRLGHMEIIENPSFDHPHFYLPHHPVFKTASLSTKLRVVFNGAKPTHTGVSINDLLMNGPVLQNDLQTILLRFRFNKIAICSDIAMMYRQIIVHPNDRDLQRIVWYAANGSICDFRLTTVTYGLTSSSFLAIRSLYQLACETRLQNPKAAEVIEQDCYVDDIMTGVDNEAEAVELIKQLTHVMEQGHFVLRKWSTNCPEILASLHQRYADTELLINPAIEVGTLGLSWIPECDVFRLHVSLGTTMSFTKRIILSEISKMFDPLGLVSPVMVLLKMFLQDLWKHGLDWDAEITGHLRSEWLRLRRNLVSLNVTIPRCVLSQSSTFELHGFCDASRKAYAACLYVREKSATGEHRCRLLCSKTRVSPLKSVTIPRLELLGAVILAQLIAKVKSSLHKKPKHVVLWSDSQIVLAWLNKNPDQCKQFVGNRVMEIQRHTRAALWRYISTHENPADIASRGTDAAKLLDCSLWWEGPEFLRTNVNFQTRPTYHDEAGAACELKPAKCLANVTLNIDSDKTFPVFSSKRITTFEGMIRVVAYCLRFACNSKPAATRRAGLLLVSELLNATDALVRIVQRESYAAEVLKLAVKGRISKRSKLVPLAPFLDENGILRVGGRLQKAEIPFTQKHPPILPAHHRFTIAFVQERHQTLKHPPMHLLLSDVRCQLWIIGGKSLVKRVTHECVICRKKNARLMNQLMGQLPKERVHPSFAFESVGLDFGGPFLIKLLGTRRQTLSKVYICPFTCLTTKAVHIEVVTGLTTDALIAALTRFTSRRGTPALLWSDNGTNMHGACNEITKICQEDAVQQHALKLRMAWKFIPPGSPHFGGIWEAGIKSVKSYLSKLIGNQTLNLEEFITVVTKVESFLNSRPISPLSDDPEDCEALTPGHFLIGRPLAALPERNVEPAPVNLLKRLQLVQRITQAFWSRWSKDYLNSLQQRTKWQMQTRNLQVGDLVLLKDEQRPQSWLTGRVTQAFEGEDKLVRVVEVQTPKGVFRRPIHKLVLLIPSNP